MTKLLKISGQIIGISFEWILIFIIYFCFFIRTSQVQTYLAQIATSYLSKELKTDIKIEKLSILFINKIEVEGMLIKDLKKDTIAYISNAYITLDDLSLNHKFIIKKAEIDNSVFKINQDKKTRDFNYEFIVDYFSSSDSTKSKPVILELNELHFKNVSFQFDDNKYTKQIWGMDYKHLDIKNINLDIENISFNKGIIRGDIQQISAIEKSGFILDTFKCKVKVSSKGVYAKNVKITTPNSIIYTPKLNLIMHQYSDYFSFTDSVNFDGYMVPSKISLKEVAYFAPELKGMNQTVYVKGVVSRKTKNIRVSDFDLKFGDHSRIVGTFNLPDFRDIEGSFFNEKVDYAYLNVKDIQNFKLPEISGLNYLKLDEHFKKLGYFETKNARLDGFQQQFVIAAKTVKTRLGTVEFKNGILFTENKINKSYFFEKSSAEDFDIKIDSFKLGDFLDNQDIGVIDGILDLSGEASSFGNIKFNDIEGNIDQFDYLGYSYKNIIISKGKYIDNVFDSKIEIKDENLNLTYNGKIDFKNKQHVEIEIELNEAKLDKLHLTNIKNSSLSSKFKIDLIGNHSNNISGSIKINELNYSEENKNFDIPSLQILINRNSIEDLLSIKSKLGTASFIGKVDFNTIIYDFENQVSKLFPAIIPIKKISKKNKLRTTNNFKYSIETNELNELLSVLLPDFKIAPKTKIEGFYNGLSEDASMKITSNSILFKDMKFENVNVLQLMNSKNIDANYSIQSFNLNDSINVKNLTFKLNGNKDILYSKLNWNPATKNESTIEWNTSVLGLDKYNITLLPSYFSLKEKKWDVVNKSAISIDGSTIDIGHFLLERERQYLSIDGRISKRNEDQLNFKLNDFKLDDFSSLISTEIQLKGLVNGWGYLSNPYTNLTYVGDANIQDLYINQKEIGDIFLQSQWINSNNSIGMSGDLIYANNETFGFNGQYLIGKANNLDFNVTFDNTDLQFVNAFVDPEILNNMKGNISGQIKVNGSLDSPKLDGNVHLSNGEARLELLNVNYKVEGNITADEYGFYINNMPLTDEEGNTGSIIGSVYHKGYYDWNYDLVFNLEDNGNRSGFAPGNIQPLDRFLMMNTSYNKENVYYGKGYGTGIVELSGYSDNLSIDVNVKTEQGTKVNFPMYGMEDIDEEESFITFKSIKDSTEKIADPKFDFTGIDLKMNFVVTPEAEIKIILDDKTEDEIFARGNGEINLALDNLNDLTLNGSFKVKEGKYNFVMRPINQEFIIQENGTVTWTGDPYNAMLDLKCFYKVNANLNEISTLQNTSSSTGTGNQEIKCYLNLTESLLKPTISFDIQAAKTNEAEQSLLNRIKSDRDLLNREFFSLLLFKKFQPIDGQVNTTGGGGSSAALDIAQSKINSMLSQVSKDYKLNVGLDKNNLTLGTSYSVGITKGFYGDKLILKGNFGVENTGASSYNNKNLPIGDVNLEYKLNDAGTFKVNIFNESNQNRIYSNNTALFTQGAGIQYQEEFNSFKNFKVYQYFLDVFRSKGNKKMKTNKKKNSKPVPSYNYLPSTPLNTKNKRLFFK